MTNPLQSLNMNSGMQSGMGSGTGSNLGSLGNIGQSQGMGQGLGQGFGSSAGSPLGSSNGTGSGGLLGGSFWDWLGFGKGNKSKIGEHNNFTPEQMKILNDILSKVGGQTGNAFDYINSILSNDPKAMAEFEKPTIDQFNQQTVPNILERFTAQGARSSSATNQTLGQAGKELQTNLASQRANLKSGAINQLMQFLQTGLSQQKTPYIQQGQQGLFQMFAKLFGGG